MILFFPDDINMPKIPKRKVKIWIKRIVSNYKKEVGEIAIIFCSNAKILTMNKLYLSHNYYTDVISFDYSNANIISGDIFICVETVKSNAKAYNISFANELYRVIIHGILHLCGFKDKTSEEKKKYRQMENEALAFFPIE